MTLEATPVIAHQLAPPDGRERVRKSRFPEFPDKRKEHKDGFRFKGIEKQRVILFRLVKPHFVEIVPSTEPFALAPAHKPLKRTTKLAIGPGQGLDKLLITHGRKDGLIQ